MNDSMGCVISYVLATDCMSREGLGVRLQIHRGMPSRVMHGHAAYPRAC
jgi:hypothetical protein